MMMTQSTGTWGTRALRELFGSEARARILDWICRLAPGELIIGADLQRELSLAPNAVWRELRRLERLGVLVAAEKIGRAKPYTVNEQSPLIRGLRSVVLYATGAIAVLRERLGEVEGIEVAFVYGSLAAGDDRPDSDVDVMVIGTVDARQLATALRGVERATRREINATRYAPDEFTRRANGTDGFLSRVLDGPKVFLNGDADALRGLAE